MIKKGFFLLLVLVFSTSCVSKKIYTDLENKYTDLKKENRKLSDDNEDLVKAKNKLEIDNATLKSEFDKLKTDRDKLLADYTASEKNLKTLQASYAALEKDSNEALTSNINKNRELLTQLEAKQKTLLGEQERLNKLKKDLEFSSKRLNELENMMAEKEASMKKLKETLSKALNAFEGKGLTIEQKN